MRFSVSFRVLPWRKNRRCANSNRFFQSKAAPRTAEGDGAEQECSGYLLAPHVRNDARDKNRSLGFSPGNLRTPTPQKHCVFPPKEVRLTLPFDFCPPCHSCPAPTLKTQDQREILCAAADCMTAGVDKEWSTQNRDNHEKGGFRRQGFLPLAGCWCCVFWEGGLCDD